MSYLLSTDAMPDYLRAVRPSHRSAGGRKPRRQRRLMIESLEDRRVLASSLPVLGEFSSDASGTVASLIARAEAGEQLRVIVEVQESALQSVSAQMTEQGATIVHQYDLFPLVLMQVDAPALHALLDSPSVVSLMEDTYEFPALNASLPVINAPEVHALGLDGDGVTVAILDTGIDRNHPFFAGRVVEEACYSNGGGGAGGVSLCPDGNTSQTGVGAANSSTAACVSGSTNLCTHGPHVAGIAAGDGTGVSGAPTAGVAPGADIIAIQVFTRFDSESVCGTGKAPCVVTYTSDQIKGLERVLALSSTYTIAAANMSLGGSTTYGSYCDSTQGSRKTAIDNLRAANIATVIASGNSYEDNGISAPACISTAVAVGSTNNSDGVSSFGNRGPLLDLFAPGESIRSAVANNGYGYKSGTSMAAPHVAGVWAVLRQADPNLSVSEILNLLQDTGQPITYSSDGTNVTTPRIDLLAAVEETQGAVDNFHWASIPDQIVGTSFPVTITAKNSSGETVTDFHGTADLSGYVGSAGEVAIGQGTLTWEYPFHAFYHDSRTQVIYLQSEIGDAATISGLALDVTTIPGQVMNNWTIRMKHTLLTSYATASLDATGWTTVYQANEPQGSTGWRNFVFSTPFEYNGIDNLMIDFSHNNSSYTSNGQVRATDTGATRTASARSDSGSGDPLTWSGTTSPTVSGSSNIPNVRLTMDSMFVPVSISPSVTSDFVDGVWTGHVTVNELATGMFLRADIGAGRRGDSHAFDVGSVQLAAPVLDELPATTTGTSSTVTWAAVADADEYYVQYATSETFASPLGSSGWITATEHTFTDLQIGATYYYRAKARQTIAGDTSTWSQTTQAEFNTGTLTSVTATPDGDVVLAGGATGTEVHVIQNPGYEDTAGWTSYVTDPVGIAAFQSTNWASEGDYSFAVAFWSDNPHVVGDYGAFRQTVDWTQVATLKFDLAAWWADKVRAQLLIGGNEVWSLVPSGAGTEYYLDQTVDVSSITGNQQLELRVETKYSNTEFCSVFWDNLRTYSPSGYTASGDILSSAIRRDVLDVWEELGFSRTTPSNTTLTIDVLPATGSTPISGYTNVTTGADLRGITDTTIRLRANLATTDTSVTPVLHDWTVVWQEPASYIESDWSNIVFSEQVLVTPAIDAEPLSKVYDGLAFSLAASVSDPAGQLPVDSNQDHFVFTFYAQPGLEGGQIPGPVNAGTYSVDIAYAGNEHYAAVPSTAFDFVIEKRPITVTAVTGTKVYDGTTGSSGTPTITSGGLADGDSATWTQTYNTKHVGTGKTLTPAGTVNDENSGNNYDVTFVNDVTGVITQVELTVAGITAADKAYDGTTDATLDVSAAALVGVFPDDTVTLNTSSAAGSFQDPEVGADKTVTIVGLTIEGADAPNYSLTQPTTTASILAGTTGIDVQVIAVAAPSESGSTALPTSLATVPLGGTYYVEVWVQDQSLPGIGISGGYVNVNYTTAVTDAVEVFNLDFDDVGQSGDIDDAGGVVRDLGGGIMGGGVGVAPQWARVAYVRFVAAEVGEANFQLTPGSLQFSLFGGGNVSWDLVDLGTPVVVDQIDATRIEMTVVSQPTATDGNGEVGTLPDSVDWVHEWQSFWVEIWVSTPASTEVGIASATVDLQYFIDYLTAQEIEYSPAFTLDRTRNIDDAQGLVSSIGGRTERTDVGDNGYVLLARVHFASTGEDDVPVDEAGGKIGPYDMRLALDDSLTRVVGATEATVPELGGNPEAELWAAVYDIDDNDQIDFGDFSFFAAAFGKNAGPPSPDSPFVWWADFDKGPSGRVDFGDLAFFAPNFNKNRTAVQSGAQTLVFPANFPAAWRPTAGGGSTEAGEGEGQASDGAVALDRAAGLGEDRAALGNRFVELLPGAGAELLARPAGLPVPERLHAVTDDVLAQIGSDGNERWTSVKAGSAGRPLVGIERNQRPMRLGSRWKALEDTLSVLAERTPGQLWDTMLDPRTALFAQLGG